MDGRQCATAVAKTRGCGDIVVVDLETGEQNVVAKSRGWDTQLRAQVQWGATDEELFFNDMNTETWQPFGVKFNPLTGARFEMDGTRRFVAPLRLICALRVCGGCMWQI